MNLDKYKGLNFMHEYFIHTTLCNGGKVRNGH